MSPNPGQECLEGKKGTEDLISLPYPLCSHLTEVAIYLNGLPTVARYCNITRMTVKIADEAVMTMCCVLRFISPAVNQLQTSSKKQWIALDFA